MTDAAADPTATISGLLPFSLGNDDAHEGPTVVAPGTKVRGDVFSESEVQVGGVIEGDVTSSRRVIVMERGEVRGRVVAPDVDIRGLVIGDISSVSTVFLRAGGEVRGTVTANRLDLERGGTLVARAHIASVEDAVR